MYGLPIPITPAQRKALIDGLDDEALLSWVHPRTLATLRRAGLIEPYPLEVVLGATAYGYTLTTAGKAAAESLARARVTIAGRLAGDRSTP